MIINTDCTIANESNSKRDGHGFVGYATVGLVMRLPLEYRRRRRIVLHPAAEIKHFTAPRGCDRRG